LGETHKKLFKYTSKKDDIAGQMTRKNQRIVQLKELLHAAKLRPITAHDSAAPLSVMPDQIHHAITVLVGTPRDFDPKGGGNELPRSVSVDARASIMRVAKHAHTRGPMWTTPVKVPLGLKMLLQDRQLPLGDPNRDVTVTLRSRAKLWGKPRYDDVKVAVDGSAQTLYFARYFSPLELFKQQSFYFFFPLFNSTFFFPYLKLLFFSLI